MSAFKAFAQIRGRAGVRDAGGDPNRSPSAAGPSSEGPPCGRAAPEKAPVDLRNFWVNGINGRPDGVNGRAQGINGRRPSGSCAAFAVPGDNGRASMSFRKLMFASAGRQLGQRMASCRSCGKSGGTCVG
jgi:hypothetical protein